MAFEYICQDYLCGVRERLNMKYYRESPNSYQSTDSDEDAATVDIRLFIHMNADVVKRITENPLGVCRCLYLYAKSPNSYDFNLLNEFAGALKS